MTLEEFKNDVLKMIEESSDKPNTYTDDPDFAKKLNTIINQVMFEACRFKKIHAREEENIGLNEEYNLNDLKDFYQLDHIAYDGEFRTFGNIVEFDGSGKAVFYYYKYPERITDETIDNEYTFDLSMDIIETIKYGVAADILKSDVSANYGQIYSSRYELMLQRLDSRYNQTMITIEEVI